MENNFNSDIKPEYCTTCEKPTIHKRYIKNKEIQWIECQECKKKIENPILVFIILRNRWINVSKNDLPIIQA